MSCSPGSTDDIVGESNIKINSNEEYEILLSLERDQRTHSITNQAELFEISEIKTITNSQGEEMNFFTFKPLDSFTGLQSVTIRTIETDDRILIHRYNFTIE
ncbi:hypothetical protein LX97_02738 [Nonlabens dokdonensis]|uniref:Uncharacterized protein n=3 Tax=Nonlabens dokdonensis TaxID=328515 RepID=L7WE79_NONDD|nr:hypothetical protein DDD_3282 [Nonlabens dokdonensis DSW-6]PZX38157.1 hypothetical protein LX97_02738 [Nonlabens dokdonensis]